MSIAASNLVADIATASPATIKVFQRHRIDFCCGGKIPLAEICDRQQLDPATLVAELNAATVTAEAPTDWTRASLTTLVDYIQRRFHRPLAIELPRLSAMMAKVVSRHGDHLPETLLPLQATFEALATELLSHIAKEDAILFPAVVALEAGRPPASMGTWINQPITVMEAEHASAGAALTLIAELTHGYQAPAWACPTFRGLYYGLSELEREMHVHVHLENHVLFPRAVALTRAAR